MVTEATKYKYYMYFAMSGLSLKPMAYGAD